MISNNTSYKIKASKGPRGIYEFDNDQLDHIYENNSVGSDSQTSNHKYQGYLRDGRYRGTPKSRTTEFRPSWSTERRGAYRGRGTTSCKRTDRESSDLYMFNRKYHESSTQNTDTASSHHGKLNDQEKKNEMKLNLPEDTRISKLLRRLSMETDQENSLAISKKLLEVLLLQDNAPYVRKAFHILGESMFEILQVSPGLLAKKQAAKALGRMGYIMGQENDFERYQHWLMNKISITDYEDLQILLMETLEETLCSEVENPILQDHIDSLMNNLISLIETTESAPVFKAILEVLIGVVEIYPDNFYPLFRDTIDLLFGWHVDHTQPLSNIEFISTNLRRIPKHFQCYLDFSMSLIENFLEDITNYSKQLMESNESAYLENVTVLVLALNTVLKCLGDTFHPNENKFTKVEFVNILMNQIIKTTSEALESYIPDNLIIASNDCIGILLGYLDSKSQILANSIYSLIDLEMSLINEFSDSTIVSTLIFISKVLKELSANLPVELIEKLMGPKSEIVKLRYSPFKIIQDSVICVYQALLNLKNVSLVQEAYRYILGDFEIVFKKILPTVQPFTQNNPFHNFYVDMTVEVAELTAVFLLRCLSQLANASSIIVMWALKPSVLELLAVHFQPYNSYLAKNSPNLQYGMLYILYSHCKCYNHYISTSSLVSCNEELANSGRFSLTEGLNKDDVPHSSPNSGNYAIILDTIYKTLSTETSCEVILLSLTWFNDILIKSESYLVNLHNRENFILMAETLVKCGYNIDEKVALEVCNNLKKLIGNKQLSWSNVLLNNICDLCKLHMSSNKERLRKAYSKLAAYVPWDIAIVEFNKTSSLNNMKSQNSISKDYNSYMVSMAQYLHLTGAIYGELCPLQFKSFMNFLLKNEECHQHDLENILICCLSLDSNTQMNMELFQDLAINSRNVLYNWITLEAAQFCVNSKLRTPLGKPNETFTKIESALNYFGNELLCSTKVASQKNKITRCRVRLLLQFIEHLEKCIFNASEGCAIAMTQPSKVVRSFFIANSNTCNEWITRIRMVVIHIALHAGETTVAVRHGQALLKDLASTGKTHTSEFEKAAMFVTVAFLNLRESEAMYGLYIWCKSLQGKKFAWIKFAAEQASKKYEIAIEGYKKILNDLKKYEITEEKAQGSSEHGNKLDLETVHFINDQIIICLKEITNWCDLTTWHEKDEVLNKIVETDRKYWFHSLDWDCAKNLQYLDNGSYPADEMMKWSFEKEPNSWSSYNILSTAENNSFNIALSMAFSSNETCSNIIESNLNMIHDSTQEYLNTAPSDLLQNIILLQYITNGLKNVGANLPANTVFLVSENFEHEINKIDSSVLRKILWWSEYFESVQKQGFNRFCNNLRLDIIKRARKEKNFKLAYRHVQKFLRDREFLMDEDDQLNDLPNWLTKKINDVTVWTLDVAKLVNEIIKLFYSNDVNKFDTFNLCAATSTAISKHTEICGGSELRKISSKILLKLANWMQINENLSVTDMNSPLGKLLMVLPEIVMLDNNPASMIPLSEMAIGKLLQFSVHQCVDLAKGWSAFGTWCYKWGRKMLHPNSSSKNNLTEEDCFDVKNLLPVDTQDHDLKEIFSILSQTRTIIDEEDIDSNEIQTSSMIKQQLCQVCVLLQNSNELQLDSLVQIWKNIQKRTYSYYNLSAEAYFKYLHLVTNSENVSKNTECNTITVTLRLLRLIVKYALELQGTLEEGLKLTPTQPWKVVIPQLFSRLNHPETYVHHSISDLLCRVAEDAPHLITFPAVVGALEGGVEFNFSEIKLPKDCLSQKNEGNEEELAEDDDNYDSDVEEDNKSLQSSFKIMVDTLSKQDSDIIAQVQLLVRELRRITLLWDELWLGTLSQLQTEINKRQHQLELEIEKVNENTNLTDDEKKSLIAEKNRIILKPITFVLEQLRDITNVYGETPHEKQFQERFSKQIDGVIDKLKNPDCPEKPNESLLPLKCLQKKLQQKFQKRSSYSLKMQDISPVLANMSNTLISMPGLNSLESVTISHVSNNVSILPTKTKPKKLVFHGSDGQTYTYLFKGLEDLHLDERIMQFLNIANTMMIHYSDPTGYNLYRARHYSVIPLGPRSGLISWVDGTTPIFTLYKRWQQREIAKPNSKISEKATTTTLRPSELFYKKLNPLLVEHGIKNLENRKEWPLNVLKQVLAELMSETPCDLLSKELWGNSVSAGDWWQVTKRFSYSIAVMSMIGYIIGLGDRHLDNMLVDLTTGEVVHIDYNVCFEKGKTLRVPEKVPFRLTPNIRDALGVTEVEGVFRLACENVLRTMRKCRETLLTLLETFVYDPLIDWTIGGEVLAGTSFGNIASINNTKLSRKELEKEITISMYNVRCTEMRTEWKENKNDITQNIDGLSEMLVTWLRIDNEISHEEDVLQDLHQQMASVKEAEAQGVNKHPLHSLPIKYNSYNKTKDTLETAKKDLFTVVAECENHLKYYSDGVNTLDSSEFIQWSIELKSISQIDDLNVFDLVKEFLHNAGKDEVVSQCEDSERNIAHLGQLYNNSIQKCLQVLQEYKAIISQCPKKFIESHRMWLYLKWCSILLENANVESCDLIYEHFQSFLDVTTNSKYPVNFVVLLDSFYKETVGQLNKMYEDMSVNRTTDIQTLEEVYANARSGITTFLGCEKKADLAFGFVIATELLILNRNFLTLETTAHRSGEWLIKLTSRDGDWFLDDLILSSSRAVDLINNLPLRPNDEHFLLYQIINCVRIANNVYKGLDELYFNFHTIILPETMKKMQNEDPSMLQIISDLNSLILSIGFSIPDMIMQMFKILPCLLMQMEVNPSYESVLDRVSILKTGFFKMICTQSDVITPGKMLLVGFNGLFEELTTEWNNLIKSLQILDVPNSWKKIDQVKDAKNISAHISNPKVHSILDNIFLLKRLQAMTDFFNLSHEMCESFKGTTSVAYTDEQLVKPIRQFVADFISRQLLGIATENIAYTTCYLLQHLGFDMVEEIEQRDIGAEIKVPLDDLYHKAWNMFLKQGIYSQNILSQASSLESNLKQAWIKIQETKKVQQKVALLQSIQVRLHSQITIQNFMYEDVLSSFNICNSVRSKFLLDLKKQLSSLQTIHDKFKSIWQKQLQLIDSAHQRLNWAKGANPSVVEISAAFENAIKIRDNYFNLEQNIASKMINLCDIILKHELFRSHSESKTLDKLFLNSLQNWRAACQYIYIKSDTLTATEESIMGLLTPSLIAESKWLEKVSEIVSDLITMSQNKLTEEKTNLFRTNDSIAAALDTLKNIYNTHCRLMSDMKGLIKTMMKIEDYNVVAQQFIVEYKEYLDNFSCIFTKLKKEVKKEDIEESMNLLHYVKQNTERIYEALMNLVVQDRTAAAMLNDYPSPVKIISPKQDIPISKGQQRNAYAVSVWRRVKMKLEGRDPDPGRKYTAQEQVDYVIREASNLDNLALLYEGWTPWV